MKTFQTNIGSRPAKFRKRLVLIEAVRNCIGAHVPVWLEHAIIAGTASDEPKTGAVKVRVNGAWSFAMPGDWIVRYEDGSLDVCQEEVFARTFEAVPDA